jgi:hypothetical protein
VSGGRRHLGLGLGDTGLGVVHLVLSAAVLDVQGDDPLGLLVELGCDRGRLGLLVPDLVGASRRDTREQGQQNEGCRHADPMSGSCRHRPPA